MLVLLLQRITFNGSNFLNGSLSVTYSPAGQAAEMLFTCAIVPQLTNSTNIVCDTAASATGQKLTSLLYFTVWQGSYSVTGTDSYEFPLVPQVFSVHGCDPVPSDPTATQNCPTAGGTTITICGFGFDTLPSAYVNGALCQNPTSLAATPACASVMTCQLPPGAGLLLCLLLSDSLL